MFIFLSFCKSSKPDQLNTILPSWDFKLGIKPMASWNYNSGNVSILPDSDFFHSTAFLQSPFFFLRLICVFKIKSATGCMGLPMSLSSLGNSWLVPCGHPTAHCQYNALYFSSCAHVNTMPHIFHLVLYYPLHCCLYFSLA